jgi:hypothetical protein
MMVVMGQVQQEVAVVVQDKQDKMLLAASASLVVREVMACKAASPAQQFIMAVVEVVASAVQQPSLQQVAREVVVPVPVMAHCQAASV